MCLLDFLLDKFFVITKLLVYVLYIENKDLYTEICYRPERIHEFMVFLS